MFSYNNAYYWKFIQWKWDGFDKRLLNAPTINLMCWMQCQASLVLGTKIQKSVLSCLYCPGADIEHSLRGYRTPSAHLLNYRRSSGQTKTTSSRIDACQLPLFTLDRLLHAWMTWILFSSAIHRIALLLAIPVNCNTTISFISQTCVKLI